ncbi:MAG: hypothetical protein V4605_06370 [Pseudomonadota bacterium]
MRSTKASAAIERLKKRSGNSNYSMVMSSGGLFSLVLNDATEKPFNAQHENAPSNKPERLCEPMQMEEFVAFVNAYGPQTPKRISQLDVAFNQQLTKSRNNRT